MGRRGGGGGLELPPAPALFWGCRKVVLVMVAALFQTPNQNKLTNKTVLFIILLSPTPAHIIIIIYSCTKFIHVFENMGLIQSYLFVVLGLYDSSSLRPYTCCVKHQATYLLTCCVEAAVHIHPYPGSRACPSCNDHSWWLYIYSSASSPYWLLEQISGILMCHIVCCWSSQLLESFRGKSLGAGK